MKDKGINTEIFFYNNSFDLFLLESLTIGFETTLGTEGGIYFAL